MGDTLQKRTKSEERFQNFQTKEEEKRSSGFKHDLVFLTLLIIFGFHAFSKLLHHKQVKVMLFACFVRITISPCLTISPGRCSY